VAIDALTNQYRLARREPTGQLSMMHVSIRQKLQLLEFVVSQDDWLQEDEQRATLIGVCSVRCDLLQDGDILDERH
jgi:hypothetical protein